MEKGSNHVIGEATLTYDEQGKLKNGYFTPTMRVDLDDETISHLYNIPCSNKSEDIQEQSELIMANWFNRVTDIELADRTEFKVVSKVKSCTKYHDTDKVKDVIIEFSLQPL